MTIKNLKKLAKRLKKAIEKKEKIILYGDSDLDGVTSVTILKETIEKLGGKICTIYFPDREKEGYGLTKKALNYLKKFSPALLIILDLGMSNFEEVREGKNLGFEIVIVDHHEPLEKLPKADILVNPKQKGDKYPFKKLATAGIIFKLSSLLLGKKMSQEKKKDFLQLVAIATIADMMPQIGENKILVKEGKKYILNSKRPGIFSFFQLPEIKKIKKLDDKISKMISILNVREVEKGFPASFRLLNTSFPKEIKKIIKKILKKHRQRKKKIDRMLKLVQKKTSKNSIVFFGKEDFEYPLISQVASLICQKYKKPTFIYKKLKKESIGSARTPSKINVIELLKKCQKYLLSFGGHPSAGGFRIKNENLEEFKKCLLLNYEKNHHLH